MNAGREGRDNAAARGTGRRVQSPSMAILTWEQAGQIPLRRRLEVMVDLLPAMERPGATWKGPDLVAEGYIKPWPGIEKLRRPGRGEGPQEEEGSEGPEGPCPLVEAYLSRSYDYGWVISDFVWHEWPEGQRINDPDALEWIAAADATLLAKILTACSRSDRFCEGTLEVAFESGLLTAIFQRMKVLLEQEPES